MFANKSIILGVVLVALFSTALGHSYLTNPTSRSNQKESNTGCRGPSCLGPCDRSRAASTRAPINIQRGASISVEWPRNNHAGGFIRLAWAATINSDSHAAFDAGVQQINCHEVGGCKPDDVNNPNGGDSGPTDGSVNPCKVSINVPTWLADGAYTLQWAWFGGAFALGDYYSCVDYVISGGAAITPAAAPVFKGGDFTYPGQQKCKYFNTDRLHACVNEPCNNPVYPAGERAGLPYMAGVVAPINAVTTQAAVAPSPVTTKAVTTKAITSAQIVSAPATTKAVTSGRVVSAPSTTAAAPVSPVSNPPSGPSSGGALANCAGANIVSSSYVVITAVETWRYSFLLSLRITVTEDTLPNWRLQVIYPSVAQTSTVFDVYNAGDLACESSSPSRHAMIKPAGNWAKNLSQGNTLDIQIEVNNAGSMMTQEFIIQNTQLKLYRV